MIDVKNVNLPYNYAILDENNCCIASRTYTCEVPLNNYIPVPDADDDYIGKYYNSITDLWYLDSGFTVEAVEINEMYHG